MRIITEKTGRFEYCYRHMNPHPLYILYCTSFLNVTTQISYGISHLELHYERGDMVGWFHLQEKANAEMDQNGFSA